MSVTVAGKSQKTLAFSREKKRGGGMNGTLWGFPLLFSSRGHFRFYWKSNLKLWVLRINHPIDQSVQIYSLIYYLLIYRAIDSSFLSPHPDGQDLIGLYRQTPGW